MGVGFYESPIGWIKIIGDVNYIYEVDFIDEKDEQEDKTDVIQQCINELREYFKGNRQEFNVPIRMEGTDFQKNVWKELCTVQYGNTASYKEVAIKIGNPNASRAVGGANNKNPIGIIVPCHRIIGTNKKLVGYAGGVDKKEWLLNHEKDNDSKIMK